MVMAEQTQEQTDTHRPYQVHVGDIFEGPMDLLVHLVRKNEVDIYDIPIALIADQYMDTIKMMKIMNIDLAGDFLVMAATLAHIKSRMLLPTPDEDEEAEDPRMDIVRPMEEFLRLKYAAEDLALRDQLDWDVFARGPAEVTEPAEEDSRDLVRVSLFELIDAFKRIVKRVSAEEFLHITVDKISVKSRISEIADLLDGKDSVTFEALFEGQLTKSQIIVTFLAVLEMAKSQLIRLMQHRQTGIIRIFHG
jgi:segregation and condensation protein A